MAHIRKAVFVLILIGALAGCSSSPAIPSPVRQETPSSRPSVNPPSSSESGSDDSADVEEGGGELTDYGYDSEDGREAGQRVSDLLRGLSDEHLGLKYGFSAAVKKVSIDRGADDSEKALTIVFDRVSWNPKFTDGGDAEPTLNPTKKWETLHCAEVVALASPGSGRLAMSTDQLITYVHRRVSDDPQTMPYFSFYFAGGSLVAIDEWYLP